MSWWGSLEVKQFLLQERLSQAVPKQTSISQPRHWVHPLVATEALLQQLTPADPQDLEAALLLLGVGCGKNKGLPVVTVLTDILIILGSTKHIRKIRSCNLMVGVCWILPTFSACQGKLPEGWKQQQLERYVKDEVVKQWVQSRVAATNLAARPCFYFQKRKETNCWMWWLSSALSSPRRSFRLTDELLKHVLSPPGHINMDKLRPQLQDRSAGSRFGARRLVHGRAITLRAWWNSRTGPPNSRGTAMFGASRGPENLILTWCVIWWDLMRFAWDGHAVSNQNWKHPAGHEMMGKFWWAMAAMEPLVTIGCIWFFHYFGMAAFTSKITETSLISGPCTPAPPSPSGAELWVACLPELELPGAVAQAGRAIKQLGL